MTGNHPMSSVSQRRGSVEISMASTYPQEREMAPDFVLRSSTGRQYQLSSFRGRRDLVLVFAGRAGREVGPLLKRLAEQREDLEFEEAQVLVIVHGNLAVAEALRKRDALPFAALADMDGAVHQRYGAGEAALVLTDRHGEIYSTHRQQLPGADEVMASLRHINAACPE